MQSVSNARMEELVRTATKTDGSACSEIGIFLQYHSIFLTDVLSEKTTDGGKVDENISVSQYLSMNSLSETGRMHIFRLRNRNKVFERLLTFKRYRSHSWNGGNGGFNADDHKYKPFFLIQSAPESELRFPFTIHKYKRVFGSR
jgi:hypothetical protein